MFSVKRALPMFTTKPDMSKILHRGASSIVKQYIKRKRGVIKTRLSIAVNLCKERAPSICDT